MDQAGAGVSVEHDPFLCTREIPLTRGRVALVDRADYDALARHKWNTVGPRDPRRQYVGRNASRRAPPPRGIYMHRVVSGAGPGDVVDHLNGNTMDNRRSNLRVGTHADNARNKAAWREGRVVGCYQTKSGRWRVHVGANHHTLYVGRYETQEDAHAAFRSAREWIANGGNLDDWKAANPRPPRKKRRSRSTCNP